MKKLTIKNKKQITSDVEIGSGLLSDELVVDFLTKNPERSEEEVTDFVDSEISKAKRLLRPYLPWSLFYYSVGVRILATKTHGQSPQRSGQGQVGSPG